MQAREDRRATNLDQLDVLPAGWGDVELGREIWVRARLGWKGLTADEYVDDGVAMLATPDIKHRAIDFAGANKIPMERYLESPEIALKVGDVLLTKDGATIGIANLVRDLPMPSSVNGSIAVLTPSGRVDGTYLYWFVTSSYAQGIFDRLRGGMGVPHLYQRDIKRIQMPLPPLTEQQQIADYLDRETAQIDTLIEAQQRLVETLRERRVGAIQTRLTQLGGKLTRLKHQAAIQTGVTLSGAGDESLPEWPYLRVANVQTGFVDTSHVKRLRLPESEARPSLLQPGDVLMTEGGDIDKLGRGSYWAGEIEPCLHQNHVFAVRPGADLDPHFLVFLLDGPVARKYFRSTARKTTNLASTNKWTLGNLPLRLPAIEVQREAVAFLDEQAAGVDALIAEAERFIELSRERRSALITAAVTGQIDVRDEEA